MFPITKILVIYPRGWKWTWFTYWHGHVNTIHWAMLLLFCAQNTRIPFPRQPVIVHVKWLLLWYF